MKSVPYIKVGQYNLKGKKSKALMAGKYIEDVIQNFKERELIKELVKQKNLALDEIFYSLATEKLDTK